MTRRDLVEGALFLPAMAALAVLLFGAFAGVIYAGEWLLSVWMWLLTGVLPLPRALAMPLAVFGTVASVTALGTLALGAWRRKPVRA